MSDLTRFTIAEARDKLSKGAFTATELTKAYLAAMQAARALNAYVVETPDKALEMAAESDRRLKAGEARAAGGRPARHQGPVLPPRACIPRPPATCSMPSSPLTNRPSPPISSATAR